ncbi:MAG: hypothetical protein ISR65_05890 [Bacteriovoracaceae bacterium]|nr:hypothetical protein [Bacteriovoracaceae bacterium]
MKIYLILLFIISSVPAVWSAPTTATKKIEVVLGMPESFTLDFAASKVIDNGAPSVVRVDFYPQLREIKFYGIKAGKARITLRDTTGSPRMIYEVRVTSNKLSAMIQQMKLYLGDVEGLEFGIKGDTAYIGGHIVVPSDIARVGIILSDPKYKSVIRLIELSPQTQRIIAKRMQDEINNGAGLGNVTVRIVNKIYWLEGSVENAGQKSNAERIAGAFLPDSISSLFAKSSRRKSVKGKPAIMNFITLIPAKEQPKEVPKMIKVTAQFVELAKGYKRVFGFRWNPILGTDGGYIEFGKNSSGGVKTNSKGTLSGIITNLFPKLASAKSAGYARIVQSGMFLTQDKKEGTVFKEITTNFTIGGGEFEKGAQAKSTFKVSVKPDIIAKEKILLSPIKVTISSVAEGDLPSQVKNEISTQIVVKSKESAVVGGISINSSRTEFDKNPPFQENATAQEGTGMPLFSFLRSKSYETTKSQYVVFITPEIVTSASEGTDKIRRKFRKRRR